MSQKCDRVILSTETLILFVVSIIYYTFVNKLQCFIINYIYCIMHHKSHRACRYVDPNRGDVGFSPHRDRQPDDSAATFRPDGTAMYTTLWLPLTDATPENSCLYVIPRCALIPIRRISSPGAAGAPSRGMFLDPNNRIQTT